MAKTLIYVLGVLSLHFTDFSHASAFNRLVLPVVDVFFLAFLFCELMLFFSSISFSKNSYNLYDLLRDIGNLRYDIRETGLIGAITTLGLSLLDCVLLFVALWYALGLLLDAALP